QQGQRQKLGWAGLGWAGRNDFAEHACMTLHWCKEPTASLNIIDLACAKPLSPKAPTAYSPRKMAA
ncbi:hypothetical protein, partial [Pseudomonas soli]|uniref:hypothetical protein n=1 Tax=Pseudomonas soli TaxID=1306993 RepID=UPI0039DF3B04